MVTDPVCHMTIEPAQAAAKVEYQGTTYYFCSNGCHKAFSAAPEKYLPTGESAEVSGKSPRGHAR